MGDAPGQDADRFHLLRLTKLLAQLFLSRYILDGADEPNRAPGRGVSLYFRMLMNETLNPVRMDYSVIYLIINTFLNGARDRVCDRGPVVGMNGLEEDIARQFGLAGTNPKYAKDLVGPTQVFVTNAPGLGDFHLPASQLSNPLGPGQIFFARP
jgi:hypothetical protein